MRRRGGEGGFSFLEREARDGNDGTSSGMKETLFSHQSVTDDASRRSQKRKKSQVKVSDNTLP